VLFVHQYVFASRWKRRGDPEVLGCIEEARIGDITKIFWIYPSGARKSWSNITPSLCSQRCLLYNLFAGVTIAGPLM
jgi:hypothetical protein